MKPSQLYILNPTYSFVFKNPVRTLRENRNEVESDTYLDCRQDIRRFDERYRHSVVFPKG